MFKFEVYKSDGLYSVKCFNASQWLVTFEGHETEALAMQAGVDFVVAAEAVKKSLFSGGLTCRLDDLVDFAKAGSNVTIDGAVWRVV